MPDAHATRPLLPFLGEENSVVPSIEERIARPKTKAIDRAKQPRHAIPSPFATTLSKNNFLPPCHAKHENTTRAGTC
ncbi:hypothetical protein CEXT_703071 [Caerostris extrusa]|uniref:Uncharacterized protein n=1 Tax=Caerostris extrusa TaxID=172846 RepID=A0AAV4XZA4_CAEEX|nr:hypothetical protein CEXT_703071 [Caerostris extrusa]